MKNKLINLITRFKSITDIGLLYASNEYEKERYVELRELVFELTNAISDHPIEALKESFPLLKDYPTVKTDIRGLLLSEDKKILLVRESADGKWSLPGGWADIGYSPKEVVIKEFKEETGLTVVSERLLAVFDKKFHPHPPQPFYVYKFVFHCVATSFEINKGFDVLDVQYFDIDNLPPLSIDRILQSQLEIVYKKVIEGDRETFFD